MFDLFDSNTMDYKSKCYIAPKIGVKEDEYGNQIEIYSKPVSYMFNIQPITAESEIQAFGELAPKMKRALVSKQLYMNKFKEFDKAYLDGVTPKDELEFGDNANYRIYSIRPQNVAIMIYFLKIVKGED